MFNKYRLLFLLLVMPLVCSSESVTLAYSIYAPNRGGIYLGNDGSVIYTTYSDGNNNMVWHDSSGLLIRTLPYTDLFTMPLEFNSEQVVLFDSSSTCLLCKSDGSSVDIGNIPFDGVSSDSLTTTMFRNNYFVTTMGDEIKVYQLDDALSSGSGLQGPQGPAGVVGPQGPKGDTGEIGPQGLEGDTGETGPKGDTGEIGPQGPAGLDSSAIQSLRASEPHIEANGDGKFDITFSVESSENLEDWSNEFNLNTTIDSNDSNKQFLRLTVE